MLNPDIITMLKTNMVLGHIKHMGIIFILHIKVPLSYQTDVTRPVIWIYVSLFLPLLTKKTATGTHMDILSTLYLSSGPSNLNIPLKD